MTRPVKKTTKKAKEDAIRKHKVVLLPTKAIIGAALVPLVYYLITAFVALPTYALPSNHDHLWHQTGTILSGFLGYVVGLFLSLGDDVRPLVPFLQTRRKEKEATPSRQ